MKPSTSDDESTWEPLNAKSTSEIAKPWRVPMADDDHQQHSPVPTYECTFRIGQPVRLATPYPEEDPSLTYYVTGIQWEHRAVAWRGWNISIATKDEIENGHGSTTDFSPSDLLPQEVPPCAGWSSKR